MSEILVNTIKKADGTGSLTVPAETGTVLTSTGDGSSLTGLNIGYGAFLANADPSNQAISSGTNTKITFNVQSYDPDSVYDHTTNYRYTPQVEGLYLISAYFQIAGSDNSAHYAAIKLYKNGSRHGEMTLQMRTGEYPSVGITNLVYLNGSSDYIEAYAFQNTGTSKTIYTSDWGKFSGFLVRAL